jgi:hypothetical protein
MKFSMHEKEQIQLWYEYVSQDSGHFGNGMAVFPGEALLIEKIRKPDENVDFNEYEVEMIRDWMHRNIKRKYGDARYLIGVELNLYHKLACE